MRSEAPNGRVPNRSLAIPGRRSLRLFDEGGFEGLGDGFGADELDAVGFACEIGCDDVGHEGAFETEFVSFFDSFFGGRDVA